MRSVLRAVSLDEVEVKTSGCASYLSGPHMVSIPFCCLFTLPRTWMIFSFRPHLTMNIKSRRTKQWEIRKILNVFTTFFFFFLFRFFILAF